MPAMTFGNWFSPFNRRQVFAAASTSLNKANRNASWLVAFMMREWRVKHGRERVRRDVMEKMVRVLGKTWLRLLSRSRAPTPEGKKELVGFPDGGAPRARPSWRLAGSTPAVDTPPSFRRRQPQIHRIAAQA